MDVFQFRAHVVTEYEQFTRSFTRIRADDIRQHVDREYQSQKYWPEPLIQINPTYRSGGTVDELVASGLLSPECAGIFRLGKSASSAGVPLPLHQHQAEAISLALAGESYVLTTGTGSGKSLSYFIPVVDACLKAKKVDPTPRTRAIVIYPMNALANSQLEELKKFLGSDPAACSVTFGRYTGQESDEERQAMAATPPDILLTNFMMLELLMTRQNDIDKAVMRNAKGLRFLVLDELHTYRGRQGADVALLVRRVREALAEDLICIGTSATMASEGTQMERNAVVANVARRLFGTPIADRNIITETLRRTTPEHETLESVRPRLRDAIQAGVPTHLDFEAMAAHPMSVWVELKLGLSYEGDKPRRAKPLTLAQAAQALQSDSGESFEASLAYLQQFMLRAHAVTDKTGKSLFAFKLHQFIAGGGKVYTTLEAPGRRAITLDGQQFVSGDETRQRRYYHTHFCRDCGQEYIPVWDTDGAEGRTFDVRNIEERQHEDDQVKFGFLMPDGKNTWEPENIERYPESWLEERADGEWRIKSAQRKFMPQAVKVRPDGVATNEQGLQAWFIPGSFRFCLACGVSHSSAGKDSLRLTSLSGEGRSSATTMLTLSALRYLYEQDQQLSAEAKKVLGFSDNRQDAALQAGHFNDFLQVLLTRAALLSAVQRASGNLLTEREVGNAVFEALGFHRDDPAVRSEYMQQPELKGNTRRQVQEAMRSILGYRTYFDLRRGWRFNNPNLEQLGLVRIEYQDLEDLASDASEWAEAPQVLQAATPAERARVLRELFDFMRQGLCIATRYLDRTELEQLRTQSYANLREPWGFTEDERPVAARWFVTSRPKEETDRRGRRLQVEDFLLIGSSRSRLGRSLRHGSTWGGANPFYKSINDQTWGAVVGALLKAAESYGLVRKEETDVGLTGWQLNGTALLWQLGDGQSQRQAEDNAFFRGLYRNIAGLLDSPVHQLFEFEAREHTAQVEQDDRLEREARFRFTEKDRDEWRKKNGHELEWLPVLFCSPTMELGVDISSLNTVYMRNVPPTPANYAQRSGRAGRAGQPALVITYCASQSPHDQYYFRDPVRMVHGQVNAPTLDLANLELVKSHMHAIWLAETGRRLGNSVRDLLDMNQPEALPIMEEVAADLDKPEAKRRAHQRGLRVLSMLANELTPRNAPWYNEHWAESVFQRTYQEFDASLQRWRDLYRATAQAIELNFKIENNPAASERERREAQQRHNEARKQRDLLLAGDSAFNSDFYTYRYLASQGFLPGYNFPRLPLLAYLPARRGSIGRESFLSRPRFLALGEFGPYSLIYHEGSQYRVTKALLTITGQDQVTEGARLPTEVARLCPACGYGHFRSQRDVDRCISCGASLAEAKEVRNLYRIENVSTKRAERITANEEERVRQGYEMQTTLQFAQAEGKLQMVTTVVEDASGPLMQMQYGPAATVWRMNFGWRRRKEKSIQGFMMNPVTGHWVGGVDDGNGETESEGEAPPDKTPPQRIVPYVEDRRNILIVRPHHALGVLEPETLTTLQYALKRGIEAVYQLEESELMAEPLPTRELRQSILLFEAAEGGAGVLTRLATEPDALAAVAAKALEIIHFKAPPAGHVWKRDSLEEELDHNGEPFCEAGCYRCLLSYHNQPDHTLIDRKDKVASGLLLDLLCRLTQARTNQGTQGRAPDEHDAQLERTAGSSLEQAWLNHVNEQGYRKPDRGQHSIPAANACADFFYDEFNLAVFIDGPHHETDAQRALDAAIDRKLDDLGYLVVRFPKEVECWRDLFKNNADLFGPGKSQES
ncbi:DEAD/DEAH box helicase [Niveibacterium umoris]|uniref:Lhr-like helicase/very-short-patch-repair endonuclease n=1 Tax=Niveibacterium umoris TaxID=1193620 RepID=A0A840BMA4_9RHOO|nr:DEAD/DEAH box helicase [Niveibacterium umoris]MBB4013634.1 Lhr-like helicase/very-short-patch-repair endonuclease [Niveibacterium umoris]